MSQRRYSWMLPIQRSTAAEASVRGAGGRATTPRALRTGAVARTIALHQGLHRNQL
ncbi:MAG: hypothetical protein J2P48_17115 [Alphaproteobacteria bacterium]|nr:hypothetical protein [Alphaproteobacteria bacterium]